MTRKYSQPGYMDSDRKDRERRPEQDRPKPKQQSSGPRWKNAQDGPHTPRMAGSKTVARCANCGAVQPPLSDEKRPKCAQCESALRSCKMCLHFDPASQYECTEPVEVRISPKDRHTDCEFFAMKTTVEKDTSGLGGTSQTNGSPAKSKPITSSSSPGDARKAFEDLFKK